MMELVALLLRHGQTELNQRDVLKGLMDPPLDDEGIQQAHDAAAFLAKFPIQRHMCSPLLRAFMTAQIVDSIIHVSPIQTRELFPWDLGTKFMNVPKKDSGLERFVDEPDETPENGVSLTDTMRRIHGFFSAELRANVLTLYDTHNSVITCLSELLKDGASRKRRHPEMDGIVDPGGVVGIFMNEGKYEMQPLFGQLDGEKYASS